MSSSWSLPDMLDTTLRPLVNTTLENAGRRLVALGSGANAVTFAGLVAGIAAAVAIAFSQYWLGFTLIAVNRILDGLDGAVARATQTTDRGGYLDIVVDYVFYASVPLAFALAAPAENALPAAALLAGFSLTASSFLAFAAIAAKRGLETEAHGRKSFFYSTGLVEGSETIAFFLLMAALPGWFPALAYAFAALCVLTTLQRTLFAMKLF
jgi:phosphatidylglycerophosphate synthase